MDELKFKWLWLLMGYLMVAIVCYATLIPSPIDAGIEISDKLMHTMSYFILMAWFVLIYQNNRTRVILAVAFIIMGVLLEFLQDMGGFRYFELADMLANALGVLLAWLIVFTPLAKGLFALEKIMSKRS